MFAGLGVCLFRNVRILRLLGVHVYAYACVYVRILLHMSLRLFWALRSAYD